MRLTSGFKARCLCAMIGSLVLCSNAAASAVEILVDAALDQRSLQTASEVALQVASAAGSENSVGIVVYDEVFQRSADRAIADVAHVERISRLSASITPSEYSNIAVGIEKGISELNSEGGVLLVFGNNDILLAEAATVAKYRDWLRLVVLPDAARKSISIILAVPQSAQSSELVSIIQEYPDNRVISFSDTADAIGQLSAVLPFALPEGTQVAAVTPIELVTDQFTTSEPIQTIEPEQDQSDTEADSLTLVQDTPQDTEKAVATLPAPREVAGQSTQEAESRFEFPVLLAVMTLLVLMVLIATLLVLKRRRDGRHELTDSSLQPAAKPAPSRYLAPKQGIATALIARAAETDVKSRVANSQPRTATSSQPDEDRELELDITAPRSPVKSDATTRIASPDATAQSRSDSPKDAVVAFETGKVDELEELRKVTRHKRQTQTEN